MLFEQIDLDQIQDVTQAKRVIVGALNVVEDLQATVRQLLTTTPYAFSLMPNATITGFLGGVLDSAGVEAFMA